MIPIDPDHSLAQRLANLGNITACSRELSSGEEVGELFPEPPSRKHLHIVVQLSSKGKQNFQLHTLTNSLTQMSLQQSDGVKVKM